MKLRPMSEMPPEMRDGRTVLLRSPGLADRNPERLALAFWGPALYSDDPPVWRTSDCHHDQLPEPHEWAELLAEPEVQRHVTELTFPVYQGLCDTLNSWSWDKELVPRLLGQLKGDEHTLLRLTIEEAGHG